MTRLTHRARTILWAGTGGFIGLLLGIGVMDSDSVPFLAIPWTLLLAIFIGATVWLGRERPAEAPVAAARPAAESAQSALDVSLVFLDVPHGYPNVLGIEEPVRVGVTVRSSTGPAEGAAVRVTGRLRDGARFVAGEGVTGDDGTVALEVDPPGPGELILEAEAVLDRHVGVGEATLSLVRYEEEIERLFGEFRSYAHDALGSDSRSDTARELAEKLRGAAPPHAAKALLELARVYELVVYGERKADRRLYLALVGALLTLQEA